MRAEARVTRKLASDLERRGLSATAFSMLIVMLSAGGNLELRTLRLRLGVSKANATEVLTTLDLRGLIRRERSPRDRRAVVVWITPAGEELAREIFPGHARRVRDTFTVLDDGEKRELTKLCRKLERV